MGGWAAVETKLTLFPKPTATPAAVAPVVLPMITATKSATLATYVNGNGFVNPGDTLMYSVTVSNSGTDATGVIFTDQLNGNLTLSGAANASPIATNDSYSSYGNVGITVPDGVSDVLGNDLDPNGTPPLLTGFGNALATANATVANGVNSVTTVNGGTVVLGANGAFTYNSAAGYEGMDSFFYTISDGTKTDTAQVTITVSGMIWFVDNNAAACTSLASNCGRLSNPFSTLNAFHSINNGTGTNPASGDTLFIYRQAGADYTGPLTLLANQKVIGQGATTSIASIAGITLPTFSNALPATSGTRPNLKVMNNGAGVHNLTVSTGNTLRGFNLENSATGGPNMTGSALFGTSFNNLTTSEISITSSANTAGNCGPAINLDQSGGAAAINASFTSVSANNCTNGIVLADTTGSFTVTGNSAGLCGGSVGSGPPAAAATTTAPVTSDCTGGTIQNSTGPGMVLTNVSGISLTRIRLINSGDDGIQGTNVTNFTLASSLLDNNGNDMDESGLDFGAVLPATQGLTGTSTLTNCAITSNYSNQVQVFNNSGTLGMTVTGCTINGRAAENNNNDGMLIQPTGTATINLSVTSSSFAANKGDHIQTACGDSGTINVNITNNTFTGGHSTALGQGITISAASGVPGWSGRVDYDVNGNNIQNAISNGVAVVQGTSSAAAVFDGFVRNNIIGTSGVALSCSSQANGVYIDARGNGTHNASVTGNTIRRCYDRGILAEAGDGDSALNLTVQSNIIDQQMDDPVNTREAFQTNFGITTTNVFGNVDTNNVCLQFGGAGALANVLSHGGGAPDDFRLRKRHEATVRLPGYAGGTGQTMADLDQVVAFIRGQNTGSAGEPGSASASGAGGGYTGGASCTSPIVFAQPDNDKFKYANQTAQHSSAPGVFAQMQQWFSSFFTVATATVEAVQIERAFAWATDALTPAVVAAETRLIPPTSNPVTPARTLLVNRRGETRLVPTAALPKLFAGELITINGGGGGFTLPAGESTTIMFNATISNSFTGTAITNQANVMATGGINVNSNNLSTPVIQAPTIAKSFSPTDIALSGTNQTTSTLTLTLTNPNPSQALSGVAFTDAFPAGLAVADVPTAMVFNCGTPPTLSVSAVANATSVGITGGSILVGQPCTLQVKVKGTTAGAKVNSAGGATATQATIPGPNSPDATLNVLAAPTMTKSFGATSIAVGGTTSLTFNITNNDTTFGLNGVSFTDTLPAGLTVAATPNITGSCGSGTITATGGSGTISLSGATLGAGGTCSFSVDVTAMTTGAKNNSVALVTTETGTNSTPATATLNVFAPQTITKAFSPTSIAVSGTSTLTFTITNPAGNPGVLNGLSVTDTFPGDLVVASPLMTTNTCGGTLQNASGGALTAGANGIRLTGGVSASAGNTCTFSVNVTAPTSGAKVNTSGNVSSTEAGANNGAGGTASATLNVFAPPTVAKAFGAGIISPNTVTSMTFTVTNPAGNPANLTGVGFSDTLTDGLQIATTPNAVQNNCGGATLTGFGAGSTSVSVSNATVSTATPCTITVNVTSPTAGTINNTATSVTSTNGGAGMNSNTAQLIVAAPPTVSKAFTPSLITPGGTSTATITLNNPNAGLALTGAMLTDLLPAGVTTVGGTAATTCGPGTASQTSNSVSLSGGTIPAGGNCTLTVNVTSATNNTYTNTISPGDLTTSNSGANTNTANATLTVANPPTLSKAFAPVAITSGGTSTLTITLTNPNSNVPLTLSAPLTDTLPAGVTTVAATHANTCGGTSSQTGGSVTLTGGTIPAGGSCTLSVNVTSTNAGGNLNTIAAGALVTNGGTNATPATATLVVGSTPAITKSFSPTTIKTGATTTMTIAIANNNAALPFNGVSFTDTLPAGLTVPDAAATPTCGGTLTVASNVITLTGATIAANTTCTNTFTVTGATTGVKNNTVTVDTTNFGTGYTGTGTVTVYDVPTIAKSFTPSSVPFGGASMLGFVLSNPNSFAGGGLSGLSFSDTLPSGITVATSGPTAVCGGMLSTTAPNLVSFSGGTLGTAGPGNTCTITVNVTGTQLGILSNAVNALTSTETGTNPVNATATLTVVAPPTIAKAFSPASVPVGQVSTLTVTITNPAINTGSLTGVGFTDNFPTNVVVASVPNVSTTCGGALTDSGGGSINAGDTGIKLANGTVTTAPRTCTITVDVTPNTAGPHLNTISSVSSTEGGTNNTGAMATLETNAKPTIIPTPVTRTAGSPASNSQIATVNDAEDAENLLVVTVNGSTMATSGGITIDTITVDAMGVVKANVRATCGAVTTDFTLRVTDTLGAFNEATLKVTIDPNTPPTLSYANVAAGLNQTLTVTPTSGPTDNGSITTMTASASAGFTGTVAVNLADGKVTLNNAGPLGTHTITVKATDNCGQMTTTSFKLTVIPFLVKLTDPILCTGDNNALAVHAEVTNPNNAAANLNFNAAIPPPLSGAANTCVLLPALPGVTCTVNANNVTVTGPLPANQTLMIDYKVKLANGTPQGTQLCVDSTASFNNGPAAMVQACTNLNCPPAIANTQVSDQKAGSVLVFPFYTSKTATKADTRLTISNLANAAPTLANQTYVHLFLIEGASCQAADFFVCLTPNASVSLKASEYDPDNTGWLLAVAVDQNGLPVQQNVLIGNAFVNDGNYVDNYGAESFRANSNALAVVDNATATLFFDGGSYDAAPSQFAVEIQSPADAPGQRIVTVGLQGDLTLSTLQGAAQLGSGQIFNGNEKPSGSFSAFLSGNCQAIATISGTTPRVPNSMNVMVPSGQVGTLKFNVGAAVGLIMTPRTTAWKGIRGLHKTVQTTSTLTIPIFRPVC